MLLAMIVCFSERRETDDYSISSARVNGSYDFSIRSRVGRSLRPSTAVPIFFLPTRHTHLDRHTHDQTDRHTIHF